MRLLSLCIIAAVASGCDEGSLSSAAAEEAAKERVRQELGLEPETVLFSTVWVGRSADGESVLCGRVAGVPAEGPAIVPRRFVAGLDPARWLLFEPTSNVSLPSQPGKFVEWDTACAGERAVR